MILALALQAHFSFWNGTYYALEKTLKDCGQLERKN